MWHPAHTVGLCSRPRDTVLDMGCGVGPDFYKFKKAGVSRLVCVDISKNRWGSDATMHIYDTTIRLASNTRGALGAKKKGVPAMLCPTAQGSCCGTGGGILTRPSVFAVFSA